MTIQEQFTMDELIDQKLECERMLSQAKYEDEEVFFSQLLAEINKEIAEYVSIH